MKLLQLVPLVTEPEQLPELPGAGEEGYEGRDRAEHRQGGYQGPGEAIQNSRRRSRIHARVRQCPALRWRRTSTAASWIPWTSSPPARSCCAGGPAARPISPG